MLVFLFGISLSANNYAEPNKELYILISDTIGEKDFVGNWQYVAENVPVEYSEGIIHITNAEGPLNVEVALVSVRFWGQEVKVEGGTLNFKINVNGQDVAIKLVVKGNKIGGEGMTPEGFFALSGTKREES
ncbi:hypothetical protein KCTC52924_00379 [Arenibacter antarcticus]|nr:hypothetical protein [Arenibacter sp. H213]